MAALALFLPTAHEWVAAHPDMTIGAVTMVNMLLRLVTKDKIELT